MAVIAGGTGAGAGAGDGDDGLPVEAVAPEVLAALEERGIAVLAAPTGSGKTTALPLHLLEADWLGDRSIMLLEPRRLAARAAARRMAWVRGERVGATIGFVTRDERAVGSDTRLEVVTDGILTRRLQRDPGLAGVGLVIFDEFHERSLQADLGLALALECRRELRPDLRLLVMSATMDDERVAALLGGDGPPAPVITSDGRLHPVEIEWQPRRRDEHLEVAVVGAVLLALADDGDVLVFLPGVAEIRRTVERIEASVGSALDVDILALYGALPGEEQDRAIAPADAGRRKVVVATDVAETSVTVPGVRTVIDAGLARQPRFDPRTGMTRLVTVAASRASTDQRAGRAGRTGPGTAIRLWSKMEQGTRPRFTAPEITQVDLAGLVLELTAWGTPPEQLAWLDPPPTGAWREGEALLRLLGAVDGTGRLTSAGRRMVELPLHPRLARLVLAGEAMGTPWVGCVVASLLDERDVLRGRPDELPADVVDRVVLVDDPSRRHPNADGRALRTVRQRAEDLARRIGCRPGRMALEAVGLLLASAYPDRIAIRRQARGRFRLTSGSGAWLPESDTLAGAELVVAADLDGHRKEARIRLGAALALADLDLVPGLVVERVESLVWDRERDELVQRIERRLGTATLGVLDQPPPPGPGVIAALLERVRRRGVGSLPWTDEARGVQARVAFLAAHRPNGGWPDLSDNALAVRLDDWLGPYLVNATGRVALVRLDMAALLQAELSWDQGMALADLAPSYLALAGGRRVALAYGAGGEVSASVRVQLLYGMTATPRVLDDTVPVTLHLLSPADRPIQVTSDLGGFWSGSWREVRKEMAGRYPKHHWPERPDLTT